MEVAGGARFGEEEGGFHLGPGTRNDAVGREFEGLPREPVVQGIGGARGDPSAAGTTEKCRERERERRRGRREDRELTARGGSRRVAAGDPGREGDDRLVLQHRAQAARRVVEGVLAGRVVHGASCSSGGREIVRGTTTTPRERLATACARASAR
ncbi:hypothetical protein C4K88_07585 [Arthrobacter pityocampae]|uniref:Uncharacterized protein n=1 Tax=Arthrobacter pityocampae TaxID=547334 RepID=A0A2S5IYB3_9MICC|nr:hypothetical protein C4K88_07585 [Arthrobacter pityocampae]